MDAVCTIPYTEVLKIRQQVLWPDKSIEFVKMPFDKSDNIMHFGIKKYNKLVSVVSINVDANEMQICQFATLPEYQGKGLGKVLMSHIFYKVNEYNIQKLWCNSREEKSGFYQKFGLKKTGVTYNRNNINIIQMELNI